MSLKNILIKGIKIKPASPRRLTKSWSQEETNMLKDAVLKHGKKWSLIEKNYPIFKKNGRTQVDLKDKWRNICRSKDISYRKCKAGYLIFTKSGCDYCKKTRELISNYREFKVTDNNINMIYNFIDGKTNSYRYFPIIFKSDNIMEKNLIDLIKNSTFIGGYTDLKNKLK
jgi:glutaredoxin